MRRHDDDFGVRLGDALNFSHRAHDVRLVLEEMRKVNAVGGIVANGPGEVPKLGEHVGGGTRLAVNPNRPGLLLLLPASDV